MLEGQVERKSEGKKSAPVALPPGGGCCSLENTAGREKNAPMQMDSSVGPIEKKNES